MASRTKYEAIPVAARAALWFTVSSIIQRAVSMITMPLFTRLMTTEQYGLYSLYGSWLQVLTVITTLRLTWAVFNKGMSRYPDDRDSYTSTMQTLTTVFALVTLSIYLPLQGIVNEVTGLSTLITVAMFVEVLLTPAISLWMARQRYDFRYRPMVVVAVLIALGNGVLGLAAVALSDDKATARILSSIVMPCVIGAVLYAGNVRRARVVFVAEYARFALLFNLPLLPHYLSMYALESVDRIMVARLVGLSAAALYGVAYNIGLVMKIVTDSIASAVVPWQYRKLAGGQLAEVEGHWYAVLALSGFAAVGFVAIAPEAVLLLGGAKYASAVYVIPPVAASIVFTLAYTMFANAELYYDKNKFMMYGSLIAALVNVGLNWLLIPSLGYLAAAYTTLFCYVGLAVSHYVFLARFLHQADHLPDLSHPGRFVLVTLALLATTGVLTATYDLLLLRYGLIIAVAIGLFGNRQRIRSLVGGMRT